jgi:hypothetical protein
MYRDVAKRVLVCCGDEENEKRVAYTMSHLGPKREIGNRNSEVKMMGVKWGKA